MKLDPITLEVLHQKLRACTEEMAITLARAARSTYVKDAADFGTALVNLDGKFFAYPESMGVSGFLDLSCRKAIDAVGELQPGDVIITNHPYASGGLSTHMPDLQLVRPYFHGGRIICYGWDFIHSADVGGGVPSSISPRFNELFQEGLQIPPMKLVEAGRINQTLLALYRANSRVPDLNVADVNAMLAALAAGERRVAAIVAKHGIAAFEAAAADLTQWAAAKSREVQRRIPDGTYSFWDYMDDDFATRVPVRIRCTMTVRDGMVDLDYTGTDPQVGSAYNVPTGGIRHPWLTLKLMHLVGTWDPTIPLNYGLFENSTVGVPRGTVLNPEYPAAVGVRHATAVRVNDTLVGVLTTALPGLIPAPSGGTNVPVVIAEQDPRTGERRLSVIQMLVGGTGAQSGMDGVDGRDSGLANLYNTPVERSEADVGVLIEEYGLRRDSAGPGQWRGGTGLVMRFRILREGSSVLARGLERFVFRPWGAAGGGPGARCKVILNLGRPDERDLGKIDMMVTQPGDTITVMTAGGGGFGDPFARDPARVLADVRAGFVSAAAARRDYGVAIEDGRIDAATTAALRAAPRAARGAFDFGPERTAWESVFGDEVASDLAARLLLRSPPRRVELKRRIVEEVVPGIAEVGTRGMETLFPDPGGQRRRLADLMDRHLPRR
jgi:N-methylhydantoinase B